MVQRKHEEKTQYHMFPPECLEGINKVFMMGAKKHGKYNFKKGISISDLYDATLRHLEAIRKDEMIDPESGLHHAYHAAWNCMMIGYFAERS